MALSRLIGALALLLALAGVFPARAQTATLVPFEPVEGEVDGAAAAYRFAARTGEALSFLVEAEGQLDPVLTLRDTSGQVLIVNDDYRYPDSRDSLLEAVTIPAFGTYTATVTGFGGTAGPFRLTMLPGYARVHGDDLLASAADWRVVGDGATAEPVEGGLEIALPEGLTRAIAFDPAAAPLSDVFAQVGFGAISGASWTAGLAAVAENGDDYYAFVVSDRGDWRAVRHVGGEDTVLYDWTRHPAIRFDQGPTTLALLATRGGFDVFINGNILGHIGDDVVPAPFRVGLALGRTSPVGPVRAAFSDLRLTVPLEVDGQPIIPDRLTPAPPAGTVVELQRRRMLPGSGQMVLNVAESFAEYARPGVTLVPLASGVTFGNLAMGTTVFPRSVTGNAGGCGLVLRAQDNTRYVLAYLDGDGGYGVSERVGDGFLPGLYAQAPDWDATVAHQLLVIAAGDELHYYVDGRYVGRLDLESAAPEGGIGNAVVNFEPANTSCRFVNTWLWRW